MMDDFHVTYWVLGGAAILAALTLFVFLAIAFRRVVSTNEVHIVQSGSKTTSYGAGTGHGNTYYAWPSWVPFIGTARVTLPVSVFDLDLVAYEAYDKGRLPFVVDVKAFFRISESDVAAQRVSSFVELHNQLKAVVQGAVRSILANNEIEEIMQGRSKFGDEFTKEVTPQLNNWGVTAVKNIELMDIRDGKDSVVIHNIMAKKKSHIEMESRTEVAKNQKLANIAEVEAKKDTDLSRQIAAQEVGIRTAEAEREVALRQELKTQAIKDQQKVTKDKEMAILEVENVRKAEIARRVVYTQTAQDKDRVVLLAEGSLESAKRQAEANLELKKAEAEGITLEGTAKANSEKAMQLASVEAQTTLSKEIGQNKEYQTYLLTVRRIEAEQAIGVANAAALKEADIKVITNAGTPSAGLKSIGELFTANGGTQIGAMLEGLAQTDAGKALVKTVVGDSSTTH